MHPYGQMVEGARSSVADVLEVLPNQASVAGNPEEVQERSQVGLCTPVETRCPWSVPGVLSFAHGMVKGAVERPVSRIRSAVLRNRAGSRWPQGEEGSANQGSRGNRAHPPPRFDQTHRYPDPMLSVHGPRSSGLSSHRHRLPRCLEHAVVPPPRPKIPTVLRGPR